ncbi:hypothetical protein CA13_59470 [Planctomycetes bacterium CA13]|uniref:Uncharacterized protein n=1 Tax=Novipirellula herctigrandis TaxID=2527986 RepID=A0A5C5ZAR6_9BACT|nr:hypothetical protein CA13_59470 [Planctomycetes bacterium CA13]
MKDPFIEREWATLCDHLTECASAIAENKTEQSDYLLQARQFSDQTVPAVYRELLNRTAAAAQLAIRWQNCEQEAMIDETLDESFPASDPPAFSHAHA